MDPVPPEFGPHALETEVLALWKSRRLPPTGGVLGPPTGPALHQIEGSWNPRDFPALIAHRAVVADIDARYLALVGRRASGTLRCGTPPDPASAPTIPPLLASLGVWVGGDGRVPWDPEERPAQVQAMVARLAARELIVTRDESFRMCPKCGTLRSPEWTIYDEREGDTYLVRFPIRIKDLTVNVLVWVDAPWKLLGASALLVNPTLRYVVAGYQRRDEHELILTSASSLERLRQWIPDSTLEVVEEKTGREFEGIAYAYPLRHEFPMGGDLAAPAGTILTAADVGDSGTGVVPLVPGHGPTDARIAERLGVMGWPLLTPKGQLAFTLMHKYAGLDLETANEFVLRDLSEAGALLARLRVKRGVPYCAFCGSPLLWAPARAWCLEPSRFSPERRALFARLLPGESLPAQSEVAPWPVSEAMATESENGVALLECARCERLDAPDGPSQCPCGGTRTLVRRKLLRSIGAALSAWARSDPFPEGDSARLYLGQRRRVPSLIHHLAALSAIEGSAPEVALTVVPTAAAADIGSLATSYGADAVRAAIAFASLSETGGNRFNDQCRREFDRLRRWWAIAREVGAQCDVGTVAEFARPIAGFLGELEVEDRAIVARWERTRVLALAQFDRYAPGVVHRRVAHFLDNDLVDYLDLVRPRLAAGASLASKRAALRTLVHLLRGSAELLAPIAPFTSESVHRALSPGRTSLFDRPIAGLDRALVNDDLVAAWDRWRTVLRSVDRFRRSLGIPRTQVLRSLALVVAADDLGDRLRAERSLLSRLVRVQRLEVGSPREAWAGRQRVMHPVESEIQKVYPRQSSQILHLLQRVPPRKGAGPSGEEELSVVIDGYPVRIFPSMLSFVETLPKGVVPAPWPLGEMYIELSEDAGPARAPLPPLSSDAFWLVRRLDRRLRASPAASGSPPRVAIVTAKDPLATELRSVAAPLASALGLTEVRVTEKPAEPKPPNALTGRTRTGDAWWIHVPGLPPTPRRTKHQAPGTRLRRVSAAETTAPTGEVDYADEKLLAREEAIRTLGQELDDIVGLPLLGPSKISTAWDQGLRSVNDLRQAPFEAIAALPGFGGPIAEVVITKIGGNVPAGAALRRRAVERAAAREGAVHPKAIPPSDSPIPPAVPRAVPPAPAAPEPVPSTPEASAREAPAVLLPPPPVEPEPPAEEPTPPATEVPLPVETVIPPPPAPSAEPVEPQEPVPIAEVPVPPAPEPEAPMPSGEEATPPAAQEETPPTENVGETPLAAASPAEAAQPVAPEPVEPSVPEEIPEPAVSPEVAPVAELSAEETTEEPEPSNEEASPVGAPSSPDETVPAPEPPAAEPVPSPEPADLPVAAPVVAEEAMPVPVPEAPAEPVPPAPSTEPEPGDASQTPEIPAVPEAIESGAETPPETEEIPATPQEIEAPAEVPPASDASVAVPPADNPPPTPPEPEELTPPAPAAPELPEPVPERAPAPSPTPIAPLEPAAPEPATLPVAPAEIVPVAVPSAPPREPEPPLPPSGIELAVGESLFASLGGFLDSTSAGHPGVCIVRESPERIRARVGSRPIEVVWLSNVGRGPSLRPSDLEGLWTFLTRKLVDSHITAFFLEGIEYLVRIHGADAVLTGLVQFDREARENEARVWILLTPALMKPADLERFRTTFGPAPTAP